MALLVLVAGVNLKVVSERPGHSRIGITADLTPRASSNAQAPAFICCDNGPEPTASALGDCRFSGTGTSYVEPGSPWENPFVESFSSRMRYELLTVEQFDTVLEARVMIGDWKHEYNNDRPHNSLGWRSPLAYAAAWKAENLGGPTLTRVDP